MERKPDYIIPEGWNGDHPERGGKTLRPMGGQDIVRKAEQLFKGKAIPLCVNGCGKEADGEDGYCKSPDCTMHKNRECHVEGCENLAFVGRDYCHAHAPADDGNIERPCLDLHTCQRCNERFFGEDACPACNAPLCPDCNTVGKCPLCGTDWLTSGDAC